MPFSFKFLAMTAIATLLFQATTASPYYCSEDIYVGNTGMEAAIFRVLWNADATTRHHFDVTVLEATITTDFCEIGQHFSFDATNTNCGCSDAPDVFDGSNCATATDVNAARQEGIEVGKVGCVSTAVAITCGEGTTLNADKSSCVSTTLPYGIWVVSTGEDCATTCASESRVCTAESKAAQTELNTPEAIKAAVLEATGKKCAEDLLGHSRDYHGAPFVTGLSGQMHNPDIECVIFTPGSLQQSSCTGLAYPNLRPLCRCFKDVPWQGAASLTSGVNTDTLEEGSMGMGAFAVGNGQEAAAKLPAAAASGSDDAGSNDSSDAEIARTVFEGGIFACLLFIAYTYGTRKASAAEAQPDDRRPAYDQRGFVGVGVGSVASVSEL